ncbi:MAG TPA: tripartite tricarboxylate transporter substrate binding protein [Burkholderiales bacterium]|jgi:tripartite-type tricarboxylate transporter receptor subunit TctC|nr:tripartite tricarboxylate transporter substrate binding protein [Burkholderiales bacterium]
MKRFLLAVLFLLSGAADAAYPEKPINLVVAYSPGGGTDLIARAIAPYLEKYLGGGARIVIVHRPGAGGEIGFAAIANAPADGYTIGFVNTPPLMTIPIERAAQFGGPQRFELLGNVIDDPCNFAVHADSEIRNLKDLAAYAKANPGRATVGSSGIGSDDHLLMLMFERAAGVKMTHVPFKGAADVRTALLSKQITIGAINIGEAQQSIRGGAPMRNIGQFSPARTTVAPELATAREQGYDIELSSLRGMAAPKGVPPEIRDRLVKAVAAAAADPEFVSKATSVFAPLRYLSPADFDREIKQAEVGFRQLWKELPWGDK